MTTFHCKLNNDQPIRHSNITNIINISILDIFLYPKSEVSKK